MLTNLIIEFVIKINHFKKASKTTNH